VNATRDPSGAVRDAREVPTPLR